MSFACFINMQVEELQQAIREMKRQSTSGNTEEALCVRHDCNNNYGSNNSYSSNNTYRGKAKATVVLVEGVEDAAASTQGILANATFAAIKGIGNLTTSRRSKVRSRIFRPSTRTSRKGITTSMLLFKAEVVEPEDDVTDGDLESNSIEVNFTELPINKEWLVNSRASMHVNGNRSTLSQFIPHSKTSKVTTALGTCIPIAGNGCTKFGGNKVVWKVLYVPGMKRNLLSVGQLTDFGHLVVFDSADYYVLNSNCPKSVPKPDHV
ncbi:unnamed protein product [Calypogeia fissa]